DDKPKNNILLSLPNILMIVITLGAIAYSQIVYGHLYDNPYVQMMAAFALTNVAILGTIVLIGQEKMLEWVRRHLLQSSILQPVISPLRLMVHRTRHGFYDGIRYVALGVVVLSFIISAGYILDKELLLKVWAPVSEKVTTSFNTNKSAPVLSAFFKSDQRN